jgi:soluble lytic murein transglycosylase-like protein
MKCILILILLMFPITVYAGELSKKRIKSYVEKTYGKKAKQINWVIEKESNFKVNARKGSCIGLMQINTKVWLSKDPKYNLIKLEIIKSKKDLRNWKLNIRAGVYILRFYNWNYRKYRGDK